MLTAFALAWLVASPGRAQDGSGTSIAGPQFAHYRIGSGSGEKTVTQLSIPLVFILPVREGFSLDISTSWADTHVKSDGVETSKINGFTDTQARATVTLFGNTTMVTLGLNVPTGMYRVPTGQQEAAGQIGSDFMLYPVASMGSGAAVTGGVAFARTLNIGPLGEWNLGAGGSFRYSSPFDAYELPADVLRFEPGSESRVRVGLDRAIGDGHISVGGTYSMFTDNKVGPTTLPTGARTLGQASISMPTAIGVWTLAAWDMYRAAGEIMGAASPWENISNVNLAVGFNWGGVFVQPSAEGRFWMRKGEKAGMVGTGGVKLSYERGMLSVNPSVTYSIGNVYPAGSTESIDVGGLRGMVLFRLSRQQ